MSRLRSRLTKLEAHARPPAQATGHGLSGLLAAVHQDRDQPLPRPRGDAPLTGLARLLHEVREAQPQASTA